MRAVKSLFALALMCIGAPVLAQDPYVSPLFDGRERVNPEIEIVSPTEGGRFEGSFVVEIRNFDYLPEFATSPVNAFAIGTDNLGLPLKFGEGHMHGWVFEVDADGRKIRQDGAIPTPASYLRFYGAGGADYVGNRDLAFYSLSDALPPGRYKAFFQLQQNDHTGALQASAPAFPAIDSVTFVVRGAPSTGGNGEPITGPRPGNGNGRR